jgi:FKBP-type peptidyl-prolyl cis-trans isomerase (trigger factor)
MKTKKIDDIKITKLEKSRVEITGSIPKVFFSSFRKKALENINNEVTIDGFRKGKVPESMLVSKVGEMAILEEMSELALSEAYPEIIIGEKIEALGRPEISITKIAAETPLEFKIITTVLPEIKLADYKKIAKIKNNIESEKIEITEKEIGDALLKIRRSRVDHSKHDHSNMTTEEHEKSMDNELPELDQEFISSIGDFKDLNDLKDKIKLSLIKEKEIRNQEKKRISLSDAIIEESKMEVPELLIDSELKRIEAQFSDDIARMGVNLEDYLKHAKKTIDDIRKEWEPHAEKKAMLQLIINKISEIEKIIVNKNEIEEEVKHILAHYKDADRERAYTYAETVIMNEKVYKFLEEQK